MPPSRTSYRKKPSFTPYNPNTEARLPRTENNVIASPSTPRRSSSITPSSTPQPRAHSAPASTPQSSRSEVPVGRTDPVTPSHAPDGRVRVEPPSGTSTVSTLLEEIRPGRPFKRKVNTAAVKRVRRVAVIADKELSPIEEEGSRTGLQIRSVNQENSDGATSVAAQSVAGSSTGPGTIVGSRRTRAKSAVPPGAKIYEVGGTAFYESAPVKELLEVQRAKREAVRAKATAEAALNKSHRVSAVVSSITVPESEGGAGFKTMYDFIEGMFTSNDRETSLRIQRLCNDHGTEIIRHVARRAPMQGQTAALDILDEVLRGEGQALRDLFAKKQHSTLADVLAEFSMKELTIRVSTAAPVLWRLLSQAAGERPRGKQDHNPDTIFTVVGAMVGILRSRKSTKMQTVIGLFLLASGAAKRVIEVLAQAGLSLSYYGALKHLRKLSTESTAKYRDVIKKYMCGFIWDNLNIAFRVGQQRHNNKDHFDNGTTMTMLSVFDPDSSDGHAAHGSLPLEWKEPRTTRRETVDCSNGAALPKPARLEQLTDTCTWNIMDLAVTHIKGLERLRGEFGDYPSVDQIKVHKTEQYPQPARRINESSLDGTIELLITALQHVHVDKVFLRKHGLVFGDGDLLSVLLSEKVEAARRNGDRDELENLQFIIRRFGLFHCKMAACRMIINEHWGTPNQAHEGGLWWENRKLKRKPMVAGWKNKKSAPWAQANELLQLSLPAHIVDAFRIHCGSSDFPQWAKRATVTDLRRVSETVRDELFSTHIVDALRKLPDEERDITLENSVLYNRDVLLYYTFVDAIKRGDIGCVVNVLEVWALEFRGTSSMPSYADIVFSTLRRIEKYPIRLRKLFLHNWLVNLTGQPFGFKENDLLQEHHNMWAKIIYLAKGSNKSWEWLAMVTVCIFQLRDIMRTVHLEFKIPKYGTKHADPSASTEISDLADDLQANKVQEYIQNRPSKASKVPVRDLVHLGAAYADTPKAFRQFGVDPRRATNHGVPLCNDPQDTSSQPPLPSSHTPLDNPASRSSSSSGNLQQSGDSTEDPAVHDLREELIQAGILDTDELELWAAIGGGPTDEDLAADDEEFYIAKETFIQQAKEFADTWLAGELGDEGEDDEEEDHVVEDWVGDIGSGDGVRAGPTMPVEDEDYQMFAP